METVTGRFEGIDPPLPSMVLASRRLGQLGRICPGVRWHLGPAELTGLHRREARPNRRRLGRLDAELARVLTGHLPLHAGRRYIPHLAELTGEVAVAIAATVRPGKAIAKSALLALGSLELDQRLAGRGWHEETSIGRPGHGDEAAYFLGNLEADE